MMDDHVMAERARVFSYLTRHSFLHIEDALAIEKIRLFAGFYRRGQGVEKHGYHFMDVADVRVVFDALARGEVGFVYREFKGSGGEGDRAAESRVLSVAIKADKVYIELKSGPGRRTATGAITPMGKARVAVNVGMSLYEGRRLGAAIVAYVRAWDVVRLGVRRRL
ncbi:MAG TPA: hypothetical protein VLL52_08790 [Anaerolineae bacterium]|nr:hypothetical protein [Anaerolineae bacterium]